MLVLPAILSIILFMEPAMATARTATTPGQPIQAAAGGQLGDLTAMLGTLFGGGETGTQTINAGDTAALQQLLATLRGTDYNAALQGIFQQAAGQIPGFQAAYGNAMGARSGGNSAMQAALNNLLQQTTLAGAKQTADMQLQNQQIQAQAGNAVAQNTRGTQQTTKAGTQGMAKELMGVVALMQAAQKLTGAKNMEELGQKMGFGTSTAAPATQTQAATQQQAVQAPRAPVTGAPAPTAQTFADMGVFAQPGMGSMQWTGGQALQPGFANYSDQFAFGANELAQAGNVDPLDALIQVTGGFGTAPGYEAPIIQPEYIDYGFGGGVDEFQF